MNREWAFILPCVSQSNKTTKYLEDTATMEVVLTSNEAPVRKSGQHAGQWDREVALRGIWTRFFFHENLLCFQVLLQIDSGEKIIYRELRDYSEYMNTLAFLRTARKQNALVKISEKDCPLGFELEKWHGFRKG